LAQKKTFMLQSVHYTRYS